MARCSALPVALVAVAIAAAAGDSGVSRPVDFSMALDDECAAGGEHDCGVSALQRRAKVHRTAKGSLDAAGASSVPMGSDAPVSETEAPTGAVAPAAAKDVAMLGCQGPWCTTVNEFNAMFDTNEPWMMQQAIDKYSEWPSPNMGIKIGVTKDHFYEMYHGNVKSKLQEYLPQGMFGWSFGNEYRVFQAPGPENGQEVVLVREGTITFALGWLRRSMFWNAVVQPLGAGMTFPYSKLEDFDDCNKCAAELTYTLKTGGLDGSEGDRWVIVDLAVVKLA
mmetsp:Transcript_123686/g.355216  ORF Transcript_123686/g.355216 Transcript_123686/m.355216 type:complete len:278 (-) Transcript_123686:107-940(-)